MAQEDNVDGRLDVAIAGFGPTGATLAGLLGRRGRSVVVIERDREVYQLPRAVHFDHEVMRIFQGIGVAEPVLPHTRFVPSYEFWNADRQVLMAAPIDLGVTDQGWHSDYMFHQPSLERILRESALDRPEVEVRYGSFLDFVEKDDGVDVFYEDEDGRRHEVRARTLVGCDGAGSSVRRRAALELEDLEFDEPWVVVDLLGAEGLPDFCIQLCDPARPTTLVPGANGFYRFEFMLRPEETDQDMARPERLRELLAPWVDPDGVELVRAAVYRFHAIVARQWWRGRVGIAGDAAHQTPPFLGQGMCAGIRDAANLAWKLDLVLRGEAEPSLLDTYGSERGPHVREYIQRAMMLGRIICTQDEEVARVRDADMLARREKEEAPAMAANLPDPGPGVWQAGDHPEVGRLAPQPRVQGPDGPVRFDDLTGTGFRLVLRDARGWPDEKRWVDFDRVGGVPVIWSDGPGVAPSGGLWAEDVDTKAAAWFDRHGLHAFLVRPDNTVFGVAAEPGRVADLLDELRDELRNELSGRP
jgi:3-(3-hydroxy-phenyl)propionate hydroxylase